MNKYKLKQRNLAILCTIFLTILTIILLTIMNTSQIYAQSVESTSDLKSIKIASNTSENTDKDNNYLKSLTIDEHEIYPDFNKNTTTYYVPIDESTKSINVNALPEIDGNDVKISGNTNLNRNENTIRVVVTSKNNVRKTYTIIATKQKDNGVKLTNLEIEGATLFPEFSPNRFNYSTQITKHNEISPLNIIAVPEKETTNIEIIGNDDSLSEGENVVTIVLTNENNTTIYEIIVNIIVERSFFEPATGSITNGIYNIYSSAKNNIDDFFADENRTISFLVAVAIILFVMIIIVIIRMGKKNKAKKNKEKIKKRAH